MEAGSTISLIEKLYSIATNHLSLMFLAFSLVLTKSAETIQEQKPFEHLNGLAADHIDQTTRSMYTQELHTKASTAPARKRPRIN